jgi:type II restriction/modification system DNA methylase subunit YeeA
MDTKNIERYAPQARRDFIQAVTDRAAAIGIRVDKGDVVLSDITVQGDVAFVEGRPFPVALAQQRKGIEDRIKQDGFERTIEAVAYTWFNRLSALRYMELHGYLDHGYHVLSHPADEATPEIVQHAEQVDLPGLKRREIIELKLDGTQDEELYRKLLVAQCNDLHRAMPFLFERVNDATELLLPDNLLHTNSLIRRLVEEIPEEDWAHVEIVGWIYQFYIKDRHDEVIGAKRAIQSGDIPAATQLFTPNWIVQYLVQNSLGRQWMGTYPNSALREHMPYYIEPAKQTEEVQQQLAEITRDHLNPEELTVMDPACGSGHILIEAYNLLRHIYQETGYRRRDIPRLILEKNLHGLDIDERAVQLAGFALTMRAAADDRRLLRDGVGMNVVGIQSTKDMDAAQTSLHLGLPVDEIRPLVEAFRDADTFGSLIQLTPGLSNRLDALDGAVLDAIERDDALADATARRVLPFVHQARLLAAQYDVVVTNPPYMGNRYLNPALKRHLQAEFKGYDKDLFSAFMIRCRSLAREHGQLGFMSPFVWMFISTHEDLRRTLILGSTLTSLVQLEYSGFEGATVPICTFTLRNSHLAGHTSSFIRLSEFRGAANQGPRTLEAIRDRKCRWFYHVCPDEFTKIPGNPIAYWISSEERAGYRAGRTLGTACQLRKGLDTGDNNRFLRMWSEIPWASLSVSANAKAARWFPYNKGGEFRRWYGNREWVIDWGNDGGGIRSRAGRKANRPTLRNQSFYLRPGYTWTKISSGGFSARYSPPGALFDNGGSMLFAEDGLHALGALLNSCVAARYLTFLAPTLNFQPGDVGRILYVEPSVSDRLKVTRNAEELVTLSRHDYDAQETSWDFRRSPLLSRQARFDTIAESLERTVEGRGERAARAVGLEEDNNRTFIGTYGLAGILLPEVPEFEIRLALAAGEDDIERLLSYAVGCALGRYSLDESGLIYAESGNEGFDPSRYKSLAVSDDGIHVVTLDEWFDTDAANRFEEFLAVAWSAETLEENLTFVADSLSPRKSDTSRQTIRRYFAQRFFKDHLQTYKRRPIYWLFASGKKRAFQALVYLHRYNESTLARMRTAYVIPLMQRMRARVEQLDVEHKSEDTGTTRKRQIEKELNTLEDQQAELRAFDQQLQHYAEQQITLDLDDGVKVNYGKFGSLLSDVKAVTGKST